MSRSPYSSYHGRKRIGRSILIGIATALAILLAAVLAGYYFGLFNIPGQTPSPVIPGPQATFDALPTAPATPSQEPAVIIEPSSPTPSPSPSPAADLSGHAIRDISLGLVLTAPDALDETSRHGVLVDMTDTDLTALGGDFSAKLAALPYAAAWVGPDWAGIIGDDQAETALIQRCLALAGLGFDEIVLSAYAPQGGGQDLADFYGPLKAAMADAKWQGRLGLDVDQSIFAAQQNDSLISATATCFDRLYFRKTLTSGNKKALQDGGFEANGKTLVTVVKNPADLGYAWAILPPQPA